MERLLTDTGAQIPVPNPNFDLERWNEKIKDEAKQTKKTEQKDKSST